MARGSVIGQLRLGLFLSLVSVVLFGSQTPVFASDTKCRIKLSDNKLSADITNASLGSVLEKIREKTGLEFEIAEGQSERPISASFRDLPQKEALKWVLNGYNYVFLVGSAGNVEEVVIIGFCDKRGPVRDVDARRNQVSTMVVSPPTHGGMKIMHSNDSSMVIEPPSKEGMMIVLSPGSMVVEPPRKNEM